jgi:hypothetical protein
MLSSFPSRNYSCCKRPTTNRTTWLILFRSRIYQGTWSGASFKKKGKLLLISIAEGVKINQNYYQPRFWRIILLFPARFSAVLQNQMHPEMVGRQFSGFIFFHTVAKLKTCLTNTPDEKKMPLQLERASCMFFEKSFR